MRLGSCAPGGVDRHSLPMWLDSAERKSMERFVPRSRGAESTHVAAFAQMHRRNNWRATDQEFVMTVFG
jgi:hypothetical protein